MFDLSTGTILSTILTLTALATPTLAHPQRIGIPTGEMGNINGLYGKPFTSNTVLLGAGAETFAPHELTANNGHISLNGKVGFRCEKDGVTDCPHKAKTGFRVYFNGNADLNVGVAMGQQLFVTPTGRLSYNPAGSSVPRGAILGKFTITYTPGRSSIAGGHHWSFAKDETSGEKTSGMWACSQIVEDGDSEAVKADKELLAVYAGVAGFDRKQFKKCVKINTGLTPFEDGDEGVSAWAYD